MSNMSSIRVAARQLLDQSSATSQADESRVQGRLVDLTTKWDTVCRLSVRKQERLHDARNLVHILSVLSSSSSLTSSSIIIIIKKVKIWVTSSLTVAASLYKINTSNSAQLSLTVRYQSPRMVPDDWRKCWYFIVSLWHGQCSYYYGGILTSCVWHRVKAEEFQSSARQLLDWLSNAERSLRYQTPPMPDSEEQLEDHLAQLEVPVLSVCQYQLLGTLYLEAGGCLTV